MTPTQLKYSRLMAEFMGAKIERWYSEIENVQTGEHAVYSDKKYWPENQSHHPLDCLKYHTSYDWLMPVLVKFRGLKFKKTSDQIDYHHHHQQFVRLLNYGEIEQAFEALGQAIEWLNENKLLC